MVHGLNSISCFTLLLFHSWLHLRGIRKGSSWWTGKNRRRGRRNTRRYFTLLQEAARLALLDLQPAPNPSSFNFPNQVPIIFRDADEKFKSVKQVMSELGQSRPGLGVSGVGTCRTEVSWWWVTPHETS